MAARDSRGDLGNRSDRSPRTLLKLADSIFDPPYRGGGWRNLTPEPKSGLQVRSPAKWSKDLMSAGSPAVDLLRACESEEMPQSTADLAFSPSDLNAFLACPHLTALELAVKRGELEKPYRVNLARRPHPPQGRRARAALPRSLRAEGREIAEISFDDRDFERAARETEEAIRARTPTSSTRLASGTAPGAGSPTSSSGSRTAPTRSSTRSSRGTRGPAHVLQLCFYTEQVARIQGRRAGAHARRQRPRRARDLPARRLRRLLPPGAAPLPRRRRERRSTPTRYPVEHCGLCDFLERCQAQWEADDHLVLVAGVSRLQVERLENAGITTLTALAEAHARHAKCAACAPPTFERLRQPGRAPAPLPPDRRATGRSAPARGRPRLRAPARAVARATSGSTSRATRGSSRAAGSSSSSAGSSSPRTASAVYRSLRARPRATRSARRSRRFVDRRRRAPPPLPGHARLPLRRLRAHRAHPPHGRARDARGGDRRPPARRGARRPLPGHTPGAARLGAELLDQGGREALRLRARRRRSAAARKAVHDFETWLETGEESLLEGIQAYNREDCVSTLRAPPLAARAPAGDSVAPAAGRARAERGGRGARRRDGARPHGAPRRRGGGRAALAPRAAPRLPPPRGEAAVVGVLLPPQAARRGGARHEPATRSAASSPPASRSSRSARGVHVHLPGAGAQDLGDGRRPAHRAGATTSASTTSTGRSAPLGRGAGGRAAPEGAHPADAATTRRRRRRRSCGSPRTRSSTRPLDRRSSSGGRRARASAGRLAEAALSPRRQLPLRAGAARLGEDVERRAHGDRAHAGAGSGSA